MEDLLAAGESDLYGRRPLRRGYPLRKTLDKGRKRRRDSISSLLQAMSGLSLFEAWYLLRYPFGPAAFPHSESKATVRSATPNSATSSLSDAPNQCDTPLPAYTVPASACTESR